MAYSSSGRRFFKSSDVLKEIFADIDSESNDEDSNCDAEPD